MSLEEILHKHKASLTLKLEPGTEYSEYWATLSFEDGRVSVSITNDEGGYCGDNNDPMPYEWISLITGFVNDLKDGKQIPDYTLNLIPE